MDMEAWRAAIHGFAKSWTWLSDWTELKLWPPHVKSWLIGKDSDAGRDWGQEEKGTTEDERAEWHHRLDGRESEELVLDNILESPLDRQEIKPVNPKGNQFWIFIGRTDAEAQILWPPDMKSIRKNPDAGKDWREEQKGMTENEMVGWHHWLSGHEFEQTPGDSEG